MPILGPRILVGQHDQPAAQAGHVAHRRSLDAVSIAGRAEDRDQSPAAMRGDGGQLVEDLGQRIGGVRVVDDDDERLPGVDALHPAGHALDAFQARPDRGRLEVERLTDGHGRSGVVGVEAAGQMERERAVPARRVQTHMEPLGVLAHVGQPDRRRGRLAIAR